MADDNTSVGKISLVIDLTQDLEKEIGSAAKMVADGLQSQLNKTKFKVNVDTSEVKKSIENIPSSMNNAMNSTKSIVQSASQTMKNSIEDNVNRTIQNSIAQLSKFSLPGSRSLPRGEGASDILTTNKPDIYTPKVDRSNAIDVDFVDLNTKAGETLGQIESKVQETANNARESFAEASNSVKGNIDETVADAESKSNSFIAGLTAKLRNIKIPSFDFSKFQIPKFNLGNFKTPEPVLGTDAQRLQMELLTRQMDAFSNKAEEARARVRELETQISELSRPTGSPVQDKVNSFTTDKLKQELKDAEAEEEKFANKSDSINVKIMNLEEKMKSAANATNNNTKAVKGKGDSLDSTGKKGSLFGSIFSKLTGTMNTAGESSSRSSSLFEKLGLSFGQVGRMMDRMLLRMVIFNTVIRWLGDFATFIGSAVKANSQLNNSLEQIRSNLYTAFMPIYNAILPALNSLISALATATAYIASFISQLFGTTYQASFKGASALQSQIGSMDIAQKQAKKTADSLGTVGSSAKKAADGITEAASASKKGLASFDEINQLSEPSNSKTPKTPGDGVVNPITPTPNMSPIESSTQGFADRIKKVLAGIWTPFKEAWAAEGLDTINAAKYALSGIENLIGSIGRSFYTVWTNGTGTKILENMFKVLQGVFNIIGDIANIWANAWNKGNIGTQIVQDLANALNNVLSFITKVEGSIRKVLSEEGPTFANMFMQALKATTGVIENVTQKLGWIWDHGGQHAFEGLTRLGMKIIELALTIYTNFVVPFVNWFVNMISPAIATVLDIIGMLADGISKFIDWLIKSIDSSTTFIKTHWENISTTANTIWSGIKDAILDVWNNAIIPLGKALLDLGNMVITPLAGIIKDILTVAFNLVKSVIKDLWNNVLVPLGSFLKDIFTAAVKAVIDIFKAWKPVIQAVIDIIKWLWDNVLSPLLKFLAGTFSDVFHDVFKTIGDTINGLKDLFKGVIEFIDGTFSGDWSKAWTGIKDTFKGIVEMIGGIFKGVLNIVIDVINNAIKGIVGGLNSLISSAVSLANKIPGVNLNISAISAPQIPKLARGGIIDQPTLAMVGEAGKEAVVPLENTEFVDTLASAVANAILAAMQLTAGNGGNNKNNQDKRDIVLQIDGSIFARIIEPYLYAEGQRIGQRVVIKTT